MLTSLPVHMLWVSGPLSRLARLSLASFMAQGFRVTLWRYAPVPDAMGVMQADANDIYPARDDDPSDMVYLSSLFRYRVLAERGGLWADMDVVALRPDPAIDVAAMVASEKRRPFRHGEASATGEGATQVTNCFMANPVPRPGDLFHRAVDAVAMLDPESRSFETCGPHLLSRLMLEDPRHGVSILPVEACDPVAWWNVPGIFLEAREPPPSPFMHMYQSIWARRGVDAETPFPPDSMAGRLWRRFGL
ncbi:MAG: hypothetical protein NTU78_16175 [Alphaproteobacteria bacterium]|nr:hypothetical protein [Alphaproteobacteria bacterium]